MTWVTNALGPGSCGNLNSSTMMVMMTAVTPSEKDSKSDGAGASGAGSVGGALMGIVRCPVSQTITNVRFEISNFKFQILNLFGHSVITFPALLPDRLFP